MCSDTQSCKANDWVNYYYTIIQYIFKSDYGRLRADTTLFFILIANSMMHHITSMIDYMGLVN